MKYLASAVIGCILLSATPASAAQSTSYLALVLNDTSSETQLIISNPTDQTLSFTFFFIESFTDGTQRPKDFVPPEETVAPNETIVRIVPTDGAHSGMLEIRADEELSFQARQVDAEGHGPQLPIVSSKSLVPGGQTAFIQSIGRIPDKRVTGFGVLNLAGELNECTYSVIRRDGAKIFGAVIPHDPLSHNYYVDVLRTIAVDQAVDVRIQTNCTEDFYPFGLVTYGDLGGMDTLFPSQTGSSSLLPRGEKPPCPDGSICFSQPGVFHVPTRSNPGRQFTIPLPAGNYSKARLHFEVLHGGWQPTGRRYEVFWFVLNGNRDQIGYLMFLPPNRLRYTHGFNLLADQKITINRTGGINPGQKYVVDYLYDTDAARIELVLSTDGQEVIRITAVPNISVIRAKAGDRIVVHHSFDGSLLPDEPPSFGWSYENLEVEITPAKP